VECVTYIDPWVAVSRNRCRWVGATTRESAISRKFHEDIVNQKLLELQMRLSEGAGAFRRPLENGRMSWAFRVGSDPPG
jgi:hypothetical protein